MAYTLIKNEQEQERLLLLDIGEWLAPGARGTVAAATTSSARVPLSR